MLFVDGLVEIFVNSGYLALWFMLTAPGGGVPFVRKLYAGKRSRSTYGVSWVPDVPGEPPAGWFRRWTNI